MRLKSIHYYILTCALAFAATCLTACDDDSDGLTEADLEAEAFQYNGFKHLELNIAHKLNLNFREPFVVYYV